MSIQSPLIEMREDFYREGFAEDKLLAEDRGKTEEDLQQTRRLPSRVHSNPRDYNRRMACLVCLRSRSIGWASGMERQSGPFGQLSLVVL